MAIVPTNLDKKPRKDAPKTAPKKDSKKGTADKNVDFNAINAEADLSLQLARTKVSDKQPFKGVIEWVPIESITPYAMNNRTYTDEQVAKLAALIDYSGWDVPIVVNAKGIILKGHRRRLAAIRLQMTHVPAIRRTDLTEQQERAIRIADNRMAQGELDKQATSEELKLLSCDPAFEMSLMGFDEPELQTLLTYNPGGELANFPSLPDKPGAQINQITLVFTDPDDFAIVNEALDKAMPFVDEEANHKKGLACAHICREFIR